MLLSDLYRDLSYGELSNLSLANDGDGTIKDDAKPRILLYANEALLRLYAQFVLRERDILIEMHSYITNYHLLKRFARYAGATENLEKIRYIRDLPNEPFEEDVLAILEVFNAWGDKYVLNDEHSPRAVFTPQANVLQVPLPIHGQALSVRYQANHPRLTGDEAQPIWLPDTLRGALTGFIGYKVFSHMNTQESTAKAQEHLQVYQAICTEAEAKNTLSTSLSNSFNLFEIRGWV